MRFKSNKSIYQRYALPIRFWSVPNIATDRITRKQLRELLLDVEHGIFACGRFYEIKHKHLGVGIYEISLKLKEYKNE